MRPTLVDLFGLPFHAYPTMLAIAFLACTMLAVRDLQTGKPPIDANTQGGLWGFLGALLGAKIFWILQFRGPGELWRALFIWQGGLVFYGGLAGGILGLLIYLKLNKLPVFPVVDACAPYVALGEAITRIGCYMNGCCWGAVSSLPWAVRFPAHSHPFDQQVEQGMIDASAAFSKPVHPTQLYMAFGLMVAFFAIRTLARRDHVLGAPMLLYFLLYGIIRFTVELFRGDSAHSFLGMTVSQLISVIFIIFSIGAFFAYIAGLYTRVRFVSSEPHTGESSLPDDYERGA
jgi:phosphatidylglycerol:prolipoprotein diacylglycerol transferase